MQINRLNTLKLAIFGLLSFAFQPVAIGQAWQQKASLPDTSFGRHHAVTFSIGGYGYMLGGSSTQSAYMSDFYRYDPAADAWSQLPPFPGPPRSYSYAVVYNNKAYMGFGFGPTSDLSDLWEFDPVTNAWTEKAVCPGDGRGHPAFLEAGGKIYVGLGGSATGNLNDFWAYDIATDVWEQIADFPSHRRHHPFYFSIGDFPYAGFGHGSNPVAGTTIYNDLYRYNPQTKAWEQMNDFPGEQRVAGTQFSYNGKGYVLSGEGKDHFYLETGEFWEFDPIADAWTELPPMPGSGRWAPASFIIGNTVYAGSGTALQEDNTSKDEKDLWAYEFEVVSGVNPLTEGPKNLEIAPNPVQNQVFIPNPPFEDADYQILNAEGQILQSGHFSSKDGIRVDNLPAGVFTVSLKSNSGTYNARFIKV